jgi:hypothetical protein
MISFSGYDRKGVSNILKARVLESGSSKQRKTPFFRKSVNASRAAAQSAMASVVEKELSK